MKNNIEYLNNIIKSWEQSTLYFFPKAFLALVVLFLFYFLAKGAKHISLKFYDKTFKKHIEIAYLISSLFYFFFLISGVILALQILGLEKFLTKILAGAGIVGIIAGFAFKDVASNLFAGLLLKAQSPFKKDDWVNINGTYGRVTQVGWITTSIKTVPGQEVFVPNQVVYNNNFTNYSTYGMRRVILETGVSYGDDLDLVRKCALEEVHKTQDALLDQPIDMYFTEIGNSSYNFQLRFWIKFDTNDNYRRAMSDIIMRVKKRFEQENISIAYNVTTLDFGVKGGVNLFDKSIQVKSE
ncbi:mechanosensitive ion channel family protein [Ornithobacterium rhinotracheale]|uniref:mechanosensitive ion channel family protein n=1 Tax=Ornithobacterium rhinotracheale TaxID=28251 RepID=UPI00129C5DD6|nr:mechanosensitive ion channel family protein [Ornithobacterium rhinotracheale]MRI63892.1 mechanosensitive ion channel family protein [Ornithobacterium rhinotracheale]